MAVTFIVVITKRDLFYKARSFTNSQDNIVLSKRISPSRHDRSSSLFHSKFEIGLECCSVKFYHVTGEIIP